MKTHLNTLFVTTENAWLNKDGQAVEVSVEKQSKLRVPLHNLDGIVCMGWNIGVSPSLMAAAAEAGVTISFLTPYGKFQAAVIGFTSGNVLLRREQYRRADDHTASCLIAREMIAAKLANARSVLLRGARDRNGEPADCLSEAAKILARSVASARTADSLDTLRGIEGEAAAAYFGAFRHLITENSDGFNFTNRSKRPPLDPANALLSFLYAILTHDARSACEATGLDAAVGFLHRDRPGRPSLALDLVEEFRQFLADRVALSLINRRQITAADFKKRETGAVEMTDEARKTVLTAYQERKQTEVHHPFLDEKTTVGLLVHLQARLLARHLRGDLDVYPPFISK